MSWASTPRRRRRQHPQRHRLADRRHRSAGAVGYPALCQGLAPSHPQQPLALRPAAQVQRRLRRRRGHPGARGHQRHRLHGRDGWRRGARGDPECGSGSASAASPGTGISRGRPACWCGPRMPLPWRMRSCACTSTTAIAPTARRRGSNTCSTPGASRSSWARWKRSSAGRWPRAAAAHRGAEPPAPPGPHRHACAEAGRARLDRRGAAGGAHDGGADARPCRHGAGAGRRRYPADRLAEPAALRRQGRERRAGRGAGCKTIGLTAKASSIRAGLVACTGNTGCKFALSNTKGTAMAIAEWVEPRVALDTPINIHLTGCPHSCAQHYIGDIGLLAARVPRRPTARTPSTASTSHRRRLRPGCGDRPRDLSRSAGRGLPGR